MRIIVLYSRRLSGPPAKLVPVLNPETEPNSLACCQRPPEAIEAAEAAAKAQAKGWRGAADSARGDALGRVAAVIEARRAEDTALARMNA